MAEQAASSDIPLRLVLIGTLIAAIAYGLLAATFFDCLTLLIKNKKKPYTNRVRVFLAVYIATIFLFSTVTIVQAFVYIVKAVLIGELEPSSFTPKVNAPFTLCKPGRRRLTTTSAFRRSFPFLDEALKRRRRTHTRTIRVHPSLSCIPRTLDSPLSRLFSVVSACPYDAPSHLFFSSSSSLFHLSPDAHKSI